MTVSMSKNNISDLKPTTVVVSVGGSIVVPEGGLDVAFLKSFRRMILQQVKKGWRFVVVVGGCGTARHYQQASKNIGELTRDDLDWLGIHSTRLNGHLMRTIFRDVAHPIMFKDPTIVPKVMRESVLVAAGWKPGWSTDYVATRIAKRLKATLVINLSNIDYLYTADPRQDKTATPICQISWKDFRKMVGDKWDPGMNVPFDPVASRLASNSKIKVILANGKNLKNLENLLAGKEFKGTVIE